MGLPRRRHHHRITTCFFLFEIIKVTDFTCLLSFGSWVADEAEYRLQFPVSEGRLNSFLDHLTTSKVSTI